MGAMASQITSLTIVYLTVYSGADQRKHQSSASLARNSQVTGEFPAQRASNAEMFPFDDVIMIWSYANVEYLIWLTEATWRMYASVKRPSLIQIRLAYRLFGIKLLSETTLVYCWLDIV